MPRFECLAYVSGRYRGSTSWSIDRNIRQAMDVGLDLLKQGYAVHVPHAVTAHMDGELPDEHFLAADMTVLRRCDLVVLVPGWRESAGARAEVAEAKRLRIAVYEWVEPGEIRPLDSTVNTTTDSPIGELVGELAA